MLAQGKALDSDLQKAGVSLKKTGKFSLEKDSIPQIGNGESMIEAVYDLTPAAPVAKRLYFYQDKYYYLKLLSVTTAAPTKEAAQDGNSGKTEAVNFQRDLFQNWLAGIEKQASIKISSTLEKKNKG
jgi:hypothetical protein